MGIDESVRCLRNSSVETWTNRRENDLSVVSYCSIKLWQQSMRQLYNQQLSSDVCFSRVSGTATAQRFKIQRKTYTYNGYTDTPTLLVLPPHFSLDLIDEKNIRNCVASFCTITEEYILQWRLCGSFRFELEADLSCP